MSCQLKKRGKISQARLRKSAKISLQSYADGLPSRVENAIRPAIESELESEHSGSCSFAIGEMMVKKEEKKKEMNCISLIINLVLCKLNIKYCSLRTF